MPPLLRFLLRRLQAIPLTFLALTAVLYAIAMQATPEVRARAYLSGRELERGNVPVLIENAIKRYGLRDPYPLQYARWLARLAQGNWGFSPSLHEDVLPALLRRTPATAELALFATLVFVPLGLISGAAAGWGRGRAPDHAFRTLAFIATAVPPFVLAIVLLAIFYASLHWFPPERLGTEALGVVRSTGYHAYTGLLTVDGLLNGRPDISLDALRHLVLPVAALCGAHWATLGRVMRAGFIEQTRKEYVVAARARGLLNRSIVWTHAFPNAAGPALSTTIFSAAALLSGVYVVEIVFNLHGVSEAVTTWAHAPFSAFLAPDTAIVTGFGVYSVAAVQLLTLLLDVLQALVDPRLREGIAA